MSAAVSSSNTTPDPSLDASAASNTPNGAADVSTPDVDFPEGLIYPPPEIKVIVDKTAGFVAQQSNPQALEQKIRMREGKNAKFGFLNPGDAYHPYYRYRVESVKSGKVSRDETTPGGAGSKEKSATPIVDDGRPKSAKPEPPHYLLTVPKMNPLDLDILRLTALFTARKGSQFAQQIAKKEANNYQFDFLQPSHSLFGYFNRLVEQYTRVLTPPQEDLDKLRQWSGLAIGPLDAQEARASGRRVLLDRVHNRVEWERWERQKRQKESDEAEKERKEFESIDWNDFQVVSTVTFTDQDDLLDLPPPMTLAEMENMTLAQKKMAAMIMEGTADGDDSDQDEDAMDVESDVEQETTEAGPTAPQQQQPTTTTTTTTTESTRTTSVEPTPSTKSNTPAPEGGKPVQVIKTDTGAPMKIRKDYVPKSKQKAKVQTTTCRICLQQIPVDEIDEHVRIELLDPQWKEKQRHAEANRHAAGQLGHGVDVTASLKSLARHRADIFGTSGSAAQKEEETKAQRQAREAIAWDGHLASAETTSDKFKTGVNLDEQIAALHKARGLTATESNIGPQIDVNPAQATEDQINAAISSMTGQSSSTSSTTATTTTTRPAEDNLEGQPEQKKMKDTH